MDRQTGREMSALERLSNVVDNNVLAAANYAGAAPMEPPQEMPLRARLEETQMRLSAVEIEHAKAIKDLHDRLSRLERTIEG